MPQHDGVPARTSQALDPVSGFSGGAGVCLLICLAVFAVAKVGAFDTVVAFKLSIAVLLVCTPLSLLLAVLGLVVSLVQRKRVGFSAGILLASFAWGSVFLKLISG